VKYIYIKTTESVGASYHSWSFLSFLGICSHTQALPESICSHTQALPESSLTTTTTTTTTTGNASFIQHMGKAASH